jgi:hypothetical protein
MISDSSVPDCAIAEAHRILAIVDKDMSGMTKPILVVNSRYPKEVEDRIDRDYNARRNPNQSPFGQQQLLSVAEGADALFITPADRLDSGFFRMFRPP